MKNIFSTIISIIFVLSAVDALKCWRCNSESSYSEYCNDDFEIPVHPMVTCASALGGQYKAVCKKVKKYVEGKLEITRGCDYINTIDEMECKNETLPMWIQMEYCGYCDEDGCNNSVQTRPIVAVLVMSIVAFLIVFGKN